MNLKHRQILTGCIVASLCIHLMALSFFERYSLWFASEQTSKTSDWLEQVEKKEKDQILQTAFTPGSSDDSPENPSSVLGRQGEPEKIPPLVFHPMMQLQEFEIPIFTSFQAPFPFDNLLSSNQALPHFSEFPK